MTAAVATPTAAQLRSALRRVRRGHSDRTLGDLLTDVYLVGFIAVLYGGGAAVSIRRHLAQPPAGPEYLASTRAWLVLALLITFAALGWRALRMVGPLITTPPAQTWVLATPVSRAGWLRLPLVILLVTAGLIGTGLGLLGGWAGVSTHLAWVTIAGTAGAVALAGASVRIQVAEARQQQTTRWISIAALSAGLAMVGAAIMARGAGLRMPATPLPAWLVAGLAVALAVLAVRGALRALPRLDRGALAGGAQVAGAAVTAVVMLDPSLFSGIVGARRWRLAGRVHSRRIRPGHRRWVLLQADLIRLTRRWPELLTFAALALVPYAVAVFAPIATGPARIVGAYLAVDRLAAGLRTVARTPALRRALGGSDGEIKTIHLVVPGVGLIVWWWATLGAGAPTAPLITVTLLVGVLGAVYRTATRPPMSYEDAGGADSPVGPIPTTLLRRLLRGPDLVAVLVLLDLFTSIGNR